MGHSDLYFVSPLFTYLRIFTREHFTREYFTRWCIPVYHTAPHEFDSHIFLGCDFTYELKNNKMKVFDVARGSDHDFFTLLFSAPNTNTDLSAALSYQPCGLPPCGEGDVGPSPLALRPPSYMISINCAVSAHMLSLLHFYYDTILLFF